MKYSNGDRFEGEYLNNAMHGFGVYGARCPLPRPPGLPPTVPPRAAMSSDGVQRPNWYGNPFPHLPYAPGWTPNG